MIARVDPVRLTEIEHRYFHGPANTLLKCRSEILDKLKEIWNAVKQALQSRQGGALLMPNEFVPGLSGWALQSLPEVWVPTGR
jgi:hypothetical protein